MVNTVVKYWVGLVSSWVYVCLRVCVSVDAMAVVGVQLELSLSTSALHRLQTQITGCFVFLFCRIQFANTQVVCAMCLTPPSVRSWSVQPWHPDRSAHAMEPVISLIQNTPNPTVASYLWDRPQATRQPLTVYVHAASCSWSLLKTTSLIQIRR